MALQNELQQLWVRRTDVVRALAAAAAEGDRSENAEYIYRKKELAGIDRRIAYLQRRLPVLEVVRQQPAGERVYFGARVTVADERGCEREYRIVGADEIGTAADLISVDAPLARALLGKTTGEEVELQLDAGSQRLAIVSIRYPQDRD